MLKAYKYRIYPNSEQRIQIAKTFGCCRFVYNQTLAYRKDIYKKEKKSVSKTDCNHYCNRELKKNYEWLKEADKFALTNAIYNMDAAYWTSARGVVTTEPAGNDGTILLMRFPFFMKLEVVTMKDFPPSDHCAPLTKSACPPVPLC